MSQSVFSQRHLSSPFSFAEISTNKYLNLAMKPWLGGLVLIPYSQPFDRQLSLGFYCRPQLQSPAILLNGCYRFLATRANLVLIPKTQGLGLCAFTRSLSSHTTNG